jgi:gas vesicle protein
MNVNLSDIEIFVVFLLCTTLIIGGILYFINVVKPKNIMNLHDIINRLLNDVQGLAQFAKNTNDTISKLIEAVDNVIKNNNIHTDRLDKIETQLTAEIKDDE